ncbi:MAG: metallophosphoesterase family protein, partial [Paucibacter sp.]|nr:metallophosphoesterase family protein [Roseateles sp.]
LGDILSGPLLPRQTARYLMAQGWVTLAGNHERQLLDPLHPARSASDAYAQSCLGSVELDWLAALPGAVQLNDEVFLCHGTPGSDSTYFLETAIPGGLRVASSEEVEQRLAGQISTVVACGHTHIPRCLRTRAGQLLVNPGSTGLPAYDDDQPCWHVAETGSPDARYAVIERHQGRWSAALHAVPYDFEPMARLADQNGQAGWARALRTGYMR